MAKDYEKMGKQMVVVLGGNDKRVALYWKAYEEKRYLACSLHYNCFRKTLAIA